MVRHQKCINLLENNLQNICLKIYYLSFFHTSTFKIRDISTRAGEPANFLAAPAPAPDFFLKRRWLRLQLWLLIFFQAATALAPGIFLFEWPRLRLQGAKNTRLRLLLLGKIFFSPQTSTVKLQKNINQVK